MSLENSLVLVTGGAGAIGSNLVKRLQQEGARIIVLDDLSSGFEDNIAGVPDTQLVKGSITSDDALHIGERIINLERAFKIREGLTRKDETLPDRMLFQIYYCSCC